MNHEAYRLWLMERTNDQLDLYFEWWKDSYHHGGCPCFDLFLYDQFLKDLPVHE